MLLGLFVASMSMVVRGGAMMLGGSLMVARGAEMVFSRGMGR